MTFSKSDAGLCPPDRVISAIKIPFAPDSNLRQKGPSKGMGSRLIVVEEKKCKNKRRGVEGGGGGVVGD